MSSSEFAVPATSPWSPQAREQLVRYRAQATDLVKAIRADATPAEVVEKGGALIDLAGGLIGEFSNRHPQCADYLRAAQAGAARWSELDYETIERDYHDDGALPKVQKAATCYHMKDLIVHPATALVLMEQASADRKKAVHEIQEVIAHLAVVAAQ